MALVVELLWDVQPLHGCVLPIQAGRESSAVRRAEGRRLLDTASW